MLASVLENHDNETISRFPPPHFEFEFMQKKGPTLWERTCSFVPILDWLPQYKWKEYIHGDVIAGFTVGIMHVPQGMAYASLAGVPPVYGMYSSFFAAAFYMFFGTARHISIGNFLLRLSEFPFLGVFAVASMMVGACRLRLAPDAADIGNGTFPLGREIDPLVLTSALTLLVGCIQLLLGIMRLGFLTTYLSDPLIAGFTTGSAAHVFMSQLNKVFGVKLLRHEGMGMLIKMLRDVIYLIPSTNFVALVISLIGIAFLDLGRTFINPFVKKFSPIPPPLELILVVIGVIVSVCFGLKDNYDIKVVNTIPRGFPAPSVPDFTLLPYLISDAIPIAVVCYMFVVSMGKLFAKKHKYKLDSTQELYAVGFMSILSSPFPVYPVGASLSRSSVCEMSGANTQLYTFFSSLLLLTVILFLGPLLEPLPMCILACIVIVSLKSLFMQTKELPRLWRISKYDFAIWLVACLSTILTDVTKGLVLSVGFAIATIIFREQWPKLTDVTTTGHVPPQHIPEHVRVVRWEAPLHFANVTRFVEMIGDLLGKEEALLHGSALVVDCSAMSYVDVMGIDAINQLHADGKRKSTVLLLAGLNDDVRVLLQGDEACGGKVPQSSYFHTVDEALLHISTL